MCLFAPPSFDIPCYIPLLRPKTWCTFVCLSPVYVHPLLKLGFCMFICPPPISTLTHTLAIYPYSSPQTGDCSFVNIPPKNWCLFICLSPNILAIPLLRQKKVVFFNYLSPLQKPSVSLFVPPPHISTLTCSYSVPKKRCFFICSSPLTQLYIC